MPRKFDLEVSAKNLSLSCAVEGKDNVEGSRSARLLAAALAQALALVVRVAVP